MVAAEHLNEGRPPTGTETNTLEEASRILAEIHSFIPDSPSARLAAVAQVLDFCGYVSRRQRGGACGGVARGACCFEMLSQKLRDR